MSGGRPKEVKRVYIHTSLSQPVYDRMMSLIEERGKVPPGRMRDFIEACVDLWFMKDDEEYHKKAAEGLRAAGPLR